MQKNEKSVNINHLKREMYKARIAELSGALELALALLIKLEPPDSRAVSNHFVAMSAILAGGDIVNDESRHIVMEMLEHIKHDDEIKEAVFQCGPALPITFRTGTYWLWEHPDGRRWEVKGSHDYPAPPHPLFDQLHFKPVLPPQIEITDNDNHL